MTEKSQLKLPLKQIPEKTKETKTLDTKEKEEIMEQDDETPLGYRIKRTKTEDVIHKSRFLKPNSNFIIIAGTTGTGKSTALLTILPMFSNTTKYVILASKKIQDDTHDAIAKYCTSEKINYQYVHDISECTEALADTLDKKSPKEHMIVIFDDFQDSYSGNSSEAHNQIMIKCFAMLRSQNCSAIAITQTYTNFNTKLRENVNLRIIFALGNVYSVRSIIDDSAGLFFDGDNETQVRKDLKQIYKQVHLKPHQFIVISTIPPEVRIGWKTIVYPPDRAGTIEAGSLSSQKHKTDISDDESSSSDEQTEIKEDPQSKEMCQQIFDQPKTNNRPCTGLKKKHELWKQAKELGFPVYQHHTATVSQMRDFIKVATASGQAENGNTAKEIQAILNKPTAPDSARLRQQLCYRVRRWKETQEPEHLDIISTVCDELVKNGFMTVDHVKYYLKQRGMSDIIESV